MKKFVAFGIVITVVNLIAVGALCKTPKQADIRSLLTASGGGQMAIQIMNQMITPLQKAMPNVPMKFWEECARELHPDNLVNLIVPIYDRHFTHDEIKELIKFYDSPIGKKLVAELPSITQESMAAGQQIGAKIGARIHQRLKQEGYGN